MHRKQLVTSTDLNKTITSPSEITVGNIKSKENKQKDWLDIKMCQSVKIFFSRLHHLYVNHRQDVIMGCGSQLRPKNPSYFIFKEVERPQRVIPRIVKEGLAGPAGGGSRRGGPVGSATQFQGTEPGRREPPPPPPSRSAARPKLFPIEGPRMPRQALRGPPSSAVGQLTGPKPGGGRAVASRPRRAGPAQRAPLPTLPPTHPLPGTLAPPPAQSRSAVAR